MDALKKGVFMKLLTFILFVLLITQFTDAGKLKEYENHSSKYMIILVYDLSISTDHIAVLNKEHITKLIEKIAMNGGGVIYTVKIISNSTVQDPQKTEIPALNLKKLQGNQYQRKNIEAINAKRVNEFNNIKSQLVNSVSNKILFKKTENFSDIDNAFYLTSKLLDNVFYSSYNKKVIIISDLINDLPPRQGMDAMKPVKMNAGILLVRPSRYINPAKLINASQVATYTTISDAIEAF